LTETTQGNEGNGADQPRRGNGGNVTALRPLDETAALNWLRAQPGGHTNLSAAELGRRWGWHRQRVWRRLRAWTKAGLVTRRGNTVKAVTSAVAPAVTSPETKPVTRPRTKPGGSLVRVTPVVTLPATALVTLPATALVTLPAAAPGAPSVSVTNAVPVTPPVTSVVTPAPVEHHAKRDRLTIAIALGLAAVSAAFSIVGLTSIFVGAFWPVIVLGLALEAGKLRVVALLGMGRGGRWLRPFLVAAVAILMGLNAVGAYGFLAKAHIAATEKAEQAIEEAKQVAAGRVADINGRIEAQNTTIENINRQLSEIHAVIDKATAQGKTNGAMALINQQRNTLAQLQTDLQAAGRVLTDLKVEKAKIKPSPGKKEEDGSKAKAVDAELGPVQYLAALIGADSESVLRGFILVVALILDPLAVLLLLCAAPPRTKP
jgi:hypothetical protein